MSHGHYVQIPGHLSRRGVIDVGLKCVHSCNHCFYRRPDDPKGPFDFMRHAGWRDAEQLKDQARRMVENGFLTTDITGGEPILFPDIVGLVEECASHGLAPRIITLGQFLDRKERGATLLHRLLSAGLVDFRFSCHGHDESTFKTTSGGSLAKQVWAMNALDEMGFEYTSNTTIVDHNYKHLPAIARNLRSHNIYMANFLYFMPHYQHAEKVEEAVRPVYAAAAPYLREAVDIMEDAGIAVAVRYAPQCTIAGLERNHVGQVGVRHDPHEWMNMVEHTGEGDAIREARPYPMSPRDPAPGAWVVAQTERGPFLGRGSQAGVTKVFTQGCQSCSAMMVCDGVDQAYLEAAGDGELRAYMFDQRGAVLDRERLTYLAGHVVKLSPDGKPSKAVARLLKPKTLRRLPTISVVIPNYNHAAELPRCLESLANQTWLARGGHLEVIVVDDASTDDSLAVLEHEWAGTTFKLILRPKNSGGRPAAVRNEGLQAATGELMCCLDPDDWLDPTYFEEIVGVFHKNPQASIVYTGHDTFGLDEIRCVAPPYHAESETQQNVIGCMSVFRREVFEDTEGYDCDAAIRGVEDWNFWVAAVRLGHSAVALPRQLAHYCKSSTGLFETEVLPNFAEKRREVFRRNQEIYSHEFLEANLKECGVIGGIGEVVDVV